MVSTDFTENPKKGKPKRFPPHWFAKSCVNTEGTSFSMLAHLQQPQPLLLCGGAQHVALLYANKRKFTEDFWSIFPESNMNEATLAKRDFNPICMSTNIKDNRSSLVSAHSSAISWELMHQPQWPLVRGGGFKQLRRFYLLPDLLSSLQATHHLPSSTYSSVFCLHCIDLWSTLSVMSISFSFLFLGLNCSLTLIQLPITEIQSKGFWFMWTAHMHFVLCVSDRQGSVFTVRMC